MLDIQGKLDKVGLIAALVSRAPKRPGRTALMKWLYFLKVLRKVPLPYAFGLYTYGPYDSDVLDDLRYAETLGAVESTLVAYPGGRGYEYLHRPRAEEIERHAGKFLAQHEDDIDWVLTHFGNRSAVDLEMCSTIVYVDRSLAAREMSIGFADLAKRVNAIKPHLALEPIEKEARALDQLGVLRAVS